MGLAIESVAISDLLLDAGNCRTHSRRNLKAIEASLAKFGQQKPVVIGAGNVVLAGHGTVAAAQSLGWRRVDAVRSPLTGKDAKAYAIADNRTAELAAWHPERLTEALEQIEADAEATLDSTGYSQRDLKQLLGDSLRDAGATHVPEIDPAWYIVATCSSCEDQQRLYDELVMRGYECRVLTM